MRIENKWWRSLVSALLVASAWFLYSLPKETYSLTDKSKTTEESTITVEKQRRQFEEWIALFFLAFSVWLWREDLGLDGFGLFTGRQRVDPLPETKAAKAAGEAETPPPESPTDAELTGKEDAILALVRKRNAITALTVSRELGIDSEIAKRGLFKLVEAGALRLDGQIFTLTDSIENLALHKLRDELGRNFVERRLVRVGNRYEMDAVWEAVGEIFLIEIKRTPQAFGHSFLEDSLRPLVAAAPEFSARLKVTCILVLITGQRDTVPVVQEWVARMNFNTPHATVKIIVYSIDDLQR